MESRYVLRLFDAANRDEFDAIFAEMAPETDAVVQARRRWWCFDNPRGGVFALFHDDTQIAATCYLGGKILSFDGTSTSGYEIGETATDPRHQRRGLFSKLVRACVAHAAENDRSLVYGTPNSQSTPGYAKLGFEIVESSRSWLFLLPSVRYAAARVLRRGSVTIGRLGDTDRRYAVTGSDYVAATVTYPRLNAGDQDYLSWRLANTPLNYRFARIRTRRGVFECAMKVGYLGEHEVIVVAEYFLNGVKPPLASVVGLLRRAVGDLGSGSGIGIYVHAERPTGLALARLYAARVIPHRVLPICATGIQEGRGDSAWFGRFQLSDCDIG